jgi:hypothetical protein
MSAREDKVTQAWIDVFGQAPSDLGQAVHVYGEFSYNKIKQLIATSPEAKRKGVDATAHGAVVADRNSLNSNQQKYYDVAAKYGSGQVYEHDIKTWAKYGASPEHYQAELQGQIKRSVRQNPNGKYVSVSTFTEDAINTMGGEMNLRGYDTGAVIRVPKGTKMASLWVGGTKDEGDGYQTFQALGEQSGGLLGEISDITGIDEFNDVRKWVPNEIWAAADIVSMGNVTGILGGAQLKNRALEVIEEDLGIDAADYNQFQAYANVLTDLALTFGTGGAAAPVIAAKNIAATVNRAALDSDISFEDAAPQAIAIAASAYLDLPWYAEAAIKGGTTLASTGDWSQSAIAAGGSVLGQSMGATLGLTGEVATNVLVSKALGYDTRQTLERALLTSAFGMAQKRTFEKPTLAALKDFNLLPRTPTGYSFKEQWNQPWKDFLAGGLWGQLAEASVPSFTLYKMTRKAMEGEKSLLDLVPTQLKGFIGGALDHLYTSEEEQMAIEARRSKSQ